MHRVLSFQMGMAGRGFGESSEFVTKRMCFSFIFFIGFLALLGGFLLGRITSERTAQIREERKRLELANNALEIADGTRLQYNLLLEELQNIRFGSSSKKFHITNTTEKEVKEDDANDHNVKTVLSNLSLFDKISQERSSLVATLRGSYEPDRWIVLSVSGDGIRPGVELSEILAKLRKAHDWKPQRTIMFCFFDEPDDPCLDNIPKYSKYRIVAYIAVHGNAIQKNGCFVTSGSDIVKSLVLRTVEESISSNNLHFSGVSDSCKNGDDPQSWMSLPRLLTDIPHASLSFKSSNSTNTNTASEVEMSRYRRTLVQIIGLGIWRLSDSVILRWDPKEFERNVRTALRMINSTQFVEVKERIASTMQDLISGAENLNQRIDTVENKSSALASRMTNDLLMDLDRALLCPDIDFRSKTDLALIPELLTSSQDAISSFLENISKCYNDAFVVLREG